MSEWEKNSIIFFVDSFAGGTPSRSRQEYFNGHIPWVSSGEVNQPYIDQTIEQITQLGFENSSVKWIPKNSVLVAMYGATAGQVSKNLINATSNQAVLALVPKKDLIDVDFLYYQVKRNKDFILYLAQGSGQPNLSKDLVDNYPIDVPVNLAIQKRISKILILVDKIIDKTESSIAKYKAIKQGMLHDLFTRGIDIKTGKLRPKYEDEPELYKESELGMVPSDWRKGQLIDCANKNDSHSFTGGPFGSDLQTKHYTATGVRIIQLQNIGDGVFKNKYKIYTSIEKADILFNCNIFAGDIIIAKMADPIARACIIPTLEKRYLMASDGIRLAVDKKNFNSKFIMETINHNRFRTIAELKATGSTRARIGLTELREIAVCYPDKGEQDMIAQRLNTIDNKIKSEQAYFQKLQQIKTGLMNDLLTGKKKV